MVRKSSPEVRAVVAEATNAAERLILPSLVAIYSDHEVAGGAPMPRQSGTAFLVSWKGRSTLITAKHALFGHDGLADPLTKRLLVRGGLRRLGEIEWSTISCHSDADVAAVHIDDFPLAQCLPQSAVENSRAPKTAAIVGYLARDFRRSLVEGRLSPAPSVYVNRIRSVDDAIISVHYPRKTNVNTDSGEPAVAPIPTGLSGGPILNTTLLRKDVVKIIGVFVEWVDGVGYGASVSRVRQVLEEISDE